MNYKWSIHPTANEKFELRCTTEFEWEGRTVPVTAGEWFYPNIQNPESLKPAILETVERQIVWWKLQQTIKAGGESKS